MNQKNSLATGGGCVGIGCFVVFFLVIALIASSIFFVRWASSEEGFEKLSSILELSEEQLEDLISDTNKSNGSENIPEERRIVLEQLITSLQTGDYELFTGAVSEDNLFALAETDDSKSLQEIFNRECETFQSVSGVKTLANVKNVGEGEMSTLDQEMVKIHCTWANASEVSLAVVLAQENNEWKVIYFLVSISDDMLSLE
jgi:hypothetical protein